MRKSLIKIVCLLIIVGLNWTGLLAVGDTSAYFSDSAISQNESFQSGILEISLSSGSDFSPNLTPDQSAIRNINIINNGTLPFQYAIKVANIPDEFCNFVTLRAELEGTEKYNGNLNNFNVSPVEISDSQDNWVFTATLNSDNSDLEGKSCQFNFVFEGWQTNFNTLSLGFSDIKEITNNLQSSDWTGPQIFSIEATDITTSSAKIIWQTNEPSTSQVQYGMSQDYEQISPLDNTLVNNHEVLLTDLLPGTTYNYRVFSSDELGNGNFSENLNFNTFEEEAEDGDGNGDENDEGG